MIDPFASSKALHQHETPKVVAVPLSDQVFNTIRGWIITGKLRPGARLGVRELSEAVGTSMMPVRDALRRLVESGLVVNEPYKGARVRTLNVDELHEIYIARAAIEGSSAKMAALVAGSETVEKMENHWKALTTAAQDGDIIELLDRDEAILETLFKTLENNTLSSIIHGLWDKCRPYKTIWAASTFHRGTDVLWPWQFEFDLIQAVRANDGQLAENTIHTSYFGAPAVIRDHLGGASAHPGTAQAN